MKAKNQLFLSFIIVLLLASCGDEVTTEPSWDNFGKNYLKTGIYCGKCIGVCIDTIAITPTKIFYKPTTFGNGNPQSELLVKPFSEAEFNSLIATIDVKAFNALNEKSCDRCFDGCDVWYDLRTGDLNNSITLSSSSSNEVISKFAEKINVIRASFK
jgi:hypothetical protein